jgi:hypothetical protein
MDQISEILNEERIQEEYIFLALDEIVNYKEDIFDAYGRQGYIIYRNGFYIYQPIELKDEAIPMYYRFKPLTTKLYETPLEESPKMNQQIKFVKASQIKKKKSKKTFKTHKTQDILGIVTRIKAALGKAKNYIKTEYSDYETVPDDFDGIYPTVNELVKCYKNSILDRLNGNEKQILLNNVLISRINSIRDSTVIHPIDEFIYNYYDKDSNNSEDLTYSILNLRRDIYIRTNKLIDKSVTDNIQKILFRVVFKNRKQKFYEYNPETSNFDESKSYDQVTVYNKLKLKNIDLDENTAIIYGWINYDKIWPRFYIVNNTNYQEKTNLDGKIQKKGKHRGAVCGTARDVRKKDEIFKTINQLLKYNKYNDHNSKGIHKDIKPDLEKRYSSGLGKNLCEELELILRWRQLKRSKEEIDTNKIFFYNIEEGYIKT